MSLFYFLIKAKILKSQGLHYTKTSKEITIENLVVFGIKAQKNFQQQIIKQKMNRS